MSIECLIDDSVGGECNYNISGFDTIWLGNKSEIVSFNDSGNLGYYDSVTMSSTMSFFHEFETIFDTSDYTTVINVAGNRNFVHTVNMTLANNDQTTRDQLVKLGLSRVVGIARKRDGTMIVLGEISGLRVTAMTGGSGILGTDLSGFAVTLVGFEKNLGTDFVGTVPVAP